MARHHSSSNQPPTPSADLAPVTVVGAQTPRWLVAAKRGAQALFWTTVVAVCAVAVAVYVIPQAKAGSGLTILTGSMVTTDNPVDTLRGANISPGDIVAVRGVKPHEVCDGTLQVGDVATYMPSADDATLITHRIVKIERLSATGELDASLADAKYETCEVTFRGDANNVDDDPVPARAVKGLVMYTVPKVGWLINATQTKTSMRGVALGIAGLLGIAAIYFMFGRREQVVEPEWHI